jgi:hypothetical protein
VIPSEEELSPDDKSKSKEFDMQNNSSKEFKIKLQ